MAHMGPPGSNCPPTTLSPTGGCKDVQDSETVAEALVWVAGGSADRWHREISKRGFRKAAQPAHPPLTKWGRNWEIAQTGPKALLLPRDVWLQGKAVPALPLRQGLSWQGRQDLKRSRETLDPLVCLISKNWPLHSSAAGAGVHLDGAVPGGCSV